MDCVQPQHEEKNITIYDLMDEILVVCPRCQALAHITSACSESTSVLTYFQVRRLICRGCGLSKELAAQGFGYDWHADPMRDPFFRLPLWLQTKYRQYVLWAYNDRHLLLLEQYIASSLRGSKPVPKYGWHNQSLFSRLPKWMIVAKHRPSLLKAIAKLKQEKLGTN
ncbi:TFIIB-type zinc ribbon-containing protein [Scytonema sp. UIC 10036]|uniref:TFIIB-type zinc ribbon-containing protein n=1 Tax=Scytonema sp. UIC 10036 TaxID=2304196 RepID=UPI0012DAB4F2|nr:TFIIB-type zinc ribbon-containing protein [Scytonema sp. UIC 10036]MUG92824.1 TFIIB-type zinc ribbon-containing protein [Scytonema sp. UIC 10036]